ncbi:hypothetical protein ACOME3_002310 [Neoechinorhynchus agilis]
MKSHLRRISAFSDIGKVTNDDCRATNLFARKPIFCCLLFLSLVLLHNGFQSRRLFAAITLDPKPGPPISLKDLETDILSAVKRWDIQMERQKHLMEAEVVLITISVLLSKTIAAIFSYMMRLDLRNPMNRNRMRRLFSIVAYIITAIIIINIAIEICQYLIS